MIRAVMPGTAVVTPSGASSRVPYDTQNRTVRASTSARFAVPVIDTGT